MQYITSTMLNLTVIAIVISGLAAETCGQDARAGERETQPEKELLTKMLKTQVAAWNNADLEGFMSTYWKSPELTFSSGGQTTRGWQATLDRYRKKYQSAEQMGTLAFRELDIQLLAPDVALVLGRWSLKRSDDSPSGNFSLVVKKLQGHWRIVHDHSSTLEE